MTGDDQNRDRQLYRYLRFSHALNAFKNASAIICIQIYYYNNIMKFGVKLNTAYYKINFYRQRDISNDRIILRNVRKIRLFFSVAHRSIKKSLSFHAHNDICVM